MSTLSVARRAGTALVASALAASLVASGDPAHAVSSSSPAGRGATWLSHQLNSKGLIHNRQFKFDDYGLTADTALALKAIGGHKKDVRHARHALARHAVDYTTFGTDRYAGATAKLTVVAQQTGNGDARHFGGINLVKRLAQRVATGAPIAGRIEDKSSSGDFANTIGQVFAVRGLLEAGDAAGRSALKFLLRQQCGSGYFRLNFNTDKTARDQGCGKGDPADTDVTALAVVELAPVAKGHGTAQEASGEGHPLAQAAPEGQRQLRRRSLDVGGQRQQHRAGGVGVPGRGQVRRSPRRSPLGGQAPGHRQRLRDAARRRARCDRLRPSRHEDREAGRHRQDDA